MWDYLQNLAWLVGVIVGLFVFTHNAVKETFSQQLGKTLSQLNLNEIAAHWPSAMTQLFDAVFTPKHFSWRCVVRSLFISFSFTFILFLILTTWHEGSFIEVLQAYWAMMKFKFDFSTSAILVVISLLVMLILNVVPDYFSLWETRLLMKQLHQGSFLARHQGLVLLMDFLITALIYVAMVSLILMMMQVLMKGVVVDISSKYWGVLGAFDVFDRHLATRLETFLFGNYIDSNFPVAVLFVATALSTFLTSLWIWLYILAVLLMKLVQNYIAPLWRFFSQHFLSVDTKPFLALAWMSGATTTSFGLLLMPVFIIGTETVQSMKPSTASSAQYKDGVVFQDLIKDGSKGPSMVVIPAGSYRMGDIQGSGVRGGALPVHDVVIEKPFALGRYEVTFEEYDRFAKATNRTLPADFGWGRGNQPVIDVSWYDAVAYTTWLSEQTGDTYRLPSEAEWEYAARAGTETNYWWGNDVGTNNANCDGCGSQWDITQPAPVGSFQPNPYGLYDTAGNAWEWVQDCYVPSYHLAPNDGSAREAKICSTRVVRGGSFGYDAGDARCATHVGNHPDLTYHYYSFRVARTIHP